MIRFMTLIALASIPFAANAECEEPRQRGGMRRRVNELVEYSECRDAELQALIADLSDRLDTVEGHVEGNRISILDHSVDFYDVWTEIDTLNARLGECGCEEIEESDTCDGNALMLVTQARHTDKVTKGARVKMGSTNIETSVSSTIAAVVFTLTGDDDTSVPGFDGLPNVTDAISSCSLFVGETLVSGPSAVPSNGRVLFDNYFDLDVGTTELDIWCNLADPGQMENPDAWDVRIAQATDIAMWESQTGNAINADSVCINNEPVGSGRSEVTVVNNGTLIVAYHGPGAQSTQIGSEDVLAFNLSFSADAEDIRTDELVFRANGNVQAIEAAYVEYTDEDGNVTRKGATFSSRTDVAMFRNLDIVSLRGDDSQVKLYLDISPWADPGDVYVELITSDIEAIGSDSHAFIGAGSVIPSSNIVSSTVTVY